MTDTPTLHPIIAALHPEAQAVLIKHFTEMHGAGTTVGEYSYFLGLLSALPATSPAPVRPEPAVPVKKSVTPDYIICLEDGKKLKMLKRHLKTAFGMTPDEYRQRWDLPADYPMVAPNYAVKRSDLAKQIGLGKRPR